MSNRIFRGKTFSAFCWPIGEGGVGVETRDGVLQHCGIPKRYPQVWKKGNRGRLYQVPFWEAGPKKNNDKKRCPIFPLSLARCTGPLLLPQPWLTINHTRRLTRLKSALSRPNNKLTRLRPIHSSDHFNGVTRSWRHSVYPSPPRSPPPALPPKSVNYPVQLN